MSKRGFSFVFSPLVMWIVGILALGLFIALLFILSGKSEGAINYIRNLIRLR
jgi:hypothetical protein